MATRNHMMFDRRWIANHGGKLRAKGDFNFKVLAPSKPDKPFLCADRPWESMLIGWGTMIYENGLYRLWYEARDKSYMDDFDGRLCYAESRDGICWEKPNMGLVDYNGNKNNNIVFDGNMAGGMGFHGHSVFMDPTSQENARFRMIFTASGNQWNSNDKYGIFLMSFAYSKNGIEWKWGVPEPRSVIDKPFAAFGSDTQSVVYWDPDLRSYVGYFRNWDADYGRTIARAITSDFGRWLKPGTILTVDENDQFGTDLYNNAACRYVSDGDTGHFMFISMFDHDKDTLDVRLAASRDGINYSRIDRTPFVANGDTFDKGAIYMCPGIYCIDGQCVMTYNALKNKHGEAEPDISSYDGSFAMLTFPKDRFQGLNTNRRFEFNLKRFEYNGGALDIILNATVRENGRITGGLMPAGTEPDYFEGFSPDDCAPVTGDRTNSKLCWKGGNILADRGVKDVELRLFMEDSIIYSIKVSEVKS